MPPRIKRNQSSRSSRDLPPVFPWLLLLLLAGLVLVVVIMASVPPVSRDALVQHLEVPKLYLLHGGIYQIPSLDFSYFPMNLELLYMVPLALGNDIIPKYIHFFFALATAGLIYFYLKRRINTISGLFGCLFFLSVPVIVKLSITVYVDLGLIFFSTASLLLLFKWLEKGRQLKYLLLAGVCCGLAAGTKYNGLITFFLLTLFTPFLYSRSASRPSFAKAAGYGLFFFAIALLVYSPWPIRNYLWTGNPLFPLFDSWFNPGKQPAGITMSPLLARKLLYHESWWQIVLLPVRIFFTGQDNNPQYFDGKLNPFLLILPILTFFLPEKNGGTRFEKSAMLNFVVLYFLFAFFQSGMRIRYISPIIPFLVILSVYGLQQLVELRQSVRSPLLSRSAPVAVLLAVTMMLSYNGRYIVQQFQEVRPLEYLRGEVSRDQYINRYRPEYSLIQFANKSLPKNSKILAIFLGNRGYYFDRRVVFDLRHSRSMLCAMVRRARSAETIAARLRQKKITHLLIRYDLFRDWTRQHLNPEEQIRLKTFFQTRTVQIAQKNNYGLFRLIRAAPENSMRKKEK